ncbi:MAG: dual specificity protein phosphatase family protein [Thalassovita sp.]
MNELDPKTDKGTMKMIFAEADVGRAPMHLIDTDYNGADIYIGNRQAASDPELLAKHGVTNVLNCAINLDINMVEKPAADCQNQTFGWSGVKYFKLGMVDGPGNPDDLLLAGYFQLRGLIAQKLPQKVSYPWDDGGNVLVNCRGGRSRSVTLVALYMHLERPEKYPTLSDAIAHVREYRQLDPKEWPSAPKDVLIEAAMRVAKQVKILRDAKAR